MKVAFFGAEGKVGRALVPVLERAGHDVRGDRDRRRAGRRGLDAAVDFTTPDAAPANVRAALEQGVSCVVGTTGWDPQPLDELARERGLRLFVAPNFSLGAVLMMRFAAAGGAVLPARGDRRAAQRGEEGRAVGHGARDRRADRRRARSIHSVRLPGLVAHQEVIFGGEGQLLTIRHDTTARESFADGVLLALEKLPELPPGPHGRPGRAPVKVARPRRRLDGRAFRRRAAAARRRAPSSTLVESRLVGGECSYYACMPTKTMLRAAELSSSLDRAPGMEPQRPEPEGVWSWRDWVTSDWDDAGQLEWLAGQRCAFVRGEARVARPGVVEVDGQELEYDRLVVATGSRPAIPPVDGLDGVEYWTNREATSTHEMPESLAVMGGGPVGSELAQFFARHGLAR